VKERAKLDAIQKEILQIFKEFKVVDPVMKLDIPKDAEILRCFVFLVEKYLANGEFDKIKARLAANGAQQNRELYPNKSLPMASIHAIFTCFALVAYIGNYSVAKIDVKGAYIQTEISGSPIYMKMEKSCHWPLYLFCQIYNLMSLLRGAHTPNYLRNCMDASSLGSYGMPRLKKY
jgi:hypothetical protein